MGKVLKQLAQDMADAESLRAERSREREVSKLKNQLAATNQKLKQAEADLEHAEQRVDFIRALDNPTPARFDFKPCKPAGNATAILVLSDWHVEETVDPETINGANEFNLEIAAQRIEAVFQNAVKLIEAARSLSNIKDMVVALLGDFITGYIHDELVESNSLSPVEASLFAQDHICGGLDFLLKHAGMKSITVPTCYGNHGRTTPKMRAATAAQNSYEWLMYKQLERYYKSRPGIRWKVERGHKNYLDVQGHLVRFTHGDAFRYNQGILGPLAPIRRKIAAWDKGKRADMDIAGHLHTHMTDSKAVINASLIGPAPFGDLIDGDLAPPAQTLVVYDKAIKPPVLVQQVFCD